MAKQKNLLYYYKKARKEGWALAQLNWSTAEMLKGIVQAGVVQKSPLLVGTSEGDSGFVGLRQAVGLVEAWRKDTGLPIFLNLDHGKSFAYLKAAIDAGYDDVHFDGSSLSFQKNIKEAKKVVAYAQRKNIAVVEGEFGKILGGSALHKERTIALNEKQFTEPEQARDFVQKTGVDSFAVTIGNVHGIYRQMPRLDLGRLKKIEKSVQSLLILHGGSGIPSSQIRQAIKLGIVKINVSTELRAAYTKQFQKETQKNPREVTPYKLLPSAVDAVQKVAEEKIELFGSTGKV